MAFFDAVEDDSMCEIQERQKTARQSLGIFRPVDIADLVVSPAPAEFEASQRAIIEQGSLFGDRTGDKQRATLEPLPVKAKFRYRCSDPRCDGHEQSFIDWDLGAHPTSFLILGLVYPKKKPEPQNTLSAVSLELYTVGYEGRTVDELLDALVAAKVTRLVDVRELPLSRRRGLSKTALGDSLAAVGIDYTHMRPLGNPKENRERYWAGEVEQGAEIYRRHLHNGSYSALVELAESLDDGTACLMCFERDHSVCHRDVIVESLEELRPSLAVNHL